MTELSLFSDQTPPATEAGGAPRAAVSGGTTSETECRSDRRVAAASPASPTGESGRDEPTSRPLPDQPEISTPPPTSPTGESGARLASRNGKTRNGKTRTAKARTANHPLRC